MKLSLPCVCTLTIICLLFIAPLTKSTAQSLPKQDTPKAASANVNSPTTASPADSASTPATIQSTENATRASTGATPEDTASDSSAAKTEKQNGEDRLPFLAHDRSEAEAEAPSAGGLLLRTLGALLLIVGLIVAASWGMKRMGGARFGAAQTDAPELRVLASVALGDKRSLAIIRFGERNLLVGSTAQSITLLAEDAEETNEVYASAAIPQARSVAELLQHETIEDNQRNDSTKREPHNFAGELSIASARFAPSIESSHQNGGASTL